MFFHVRNDDETIKKLKQWRDKEFENKSQHLKEGPGLRKDDKNLLSSSKCFSVLPPVTAWWCVSVWKAIPGCFIRQHTTGITKEIRLRFEFIIQMQGRLHSGVLRIYLQLCVCWLCGCRCVQLISSKRLHCHSSSLSLAPLSVCSLRLLYFIKMGLNAINVRFTV